MKEVTIDLVAKLITETDDDTVKMALMGTTGPGRVTGGAPNLNFVGSQIPTGLTPTPTAIPPPTNSSLPGMEKWFYRDPQVSYKTESGSLLITLIFILFILGGSPGSFFMYGNVGMVSCRLF